MIEMSFRLSSKNQQGNNNHHNKWDDMKKYEKFSPLSHQIGHSLSILILFARDNYFFQQIDNLFSYDDVTVNSCYDDKWILLWDSYLL